MADHLKQEDLHHTKFNIEKEPFIKIISNGNEEIVQIKRKKQLNFEDGKEDKAKPIIPREEINVEESHITINNFEVDFEEESPDVRMIGGIRGIKALRVQRDYIQDATEVHTPNMYSKYDKAPE